MSCDAQRGGAGPGRVGRKLVTYPLFCASQGASRTGAMCPPGSQNMTTWSSAACAGSERPHVAEAPLLCTSVLLLLGLDVCTASFTRSPCVRTTPNTRSEGNVNHHTCWALFEGYSKVGSKPALAASTEASVSDRRVVHAGGGSSSARRLSAFAHFEEWLRSHLSALLLLVRSVMASLMPKKQGMDPGHAL